MGFLFKVICSLFPPTCIDLDMYPTQGDIKENHLSVPVPLLLSFRKFFISKLLSLKIWLMWLTGCVDLTLLDTSFAFKVARRCEWSPPIAPCSVLFVFRTRNCWAVSHPLFVFVFGTFGEAGRPSILGGEDFHQLFLRRCFGWESEKLALILVSCGLSLREMEFWGCGSGGAHGSLSLRHFFSLFEFQGYKSQDSRITMKDQLVNVFTSERKRKPNEC